jgi:hypothetical protein
MILRSVTAIAVATIAAPVLAQDATAAATALVDLIAPQAVASKALEAQLAEMRKGATIRQMFAGNQRFQMEASKNTPAFNAALARMGAIQADSVGPILREMIPATRTASIAAYARAFTAAELNAISAFYRTPAGAKFLRTQPQVQMEVQRTVAAKYGPRLEAAQKNAGPKLEAELKKLFPPQAGG